MKTFRFIAIITCIIALTSCKLQDENPEIDALSFVTMKMSASHTVQVTTDSNENIIFNLDDKAEAPAIAKDARCLAFYRIDPLPHLLYEITEVPISKPIKRESQTEEELGIDSLYYMSIFYAGADYLNIYMESYENDKTMNLVWENPDTYPATTDTLRLSLHYKKGLPSGKATKRPFCFDLRSFNNDKESVCLSITFNCLQSNGSTKRQIWEKQYKWKNIKN